MVLLTIISPSSYSTGDHVSIGLLSILIPSFSFASGHSNFIQAGGLAVARAPVNMNPFLGTCHFQESATK
jgi:hypothetical protein